MFATQPVIASETLRFPLRAVVASSSAMRSSRSAQQSPPKSAARAGSAFIAQANPAAPSNEIDFLNFIVSPERSSVDHGVWLSKELFLMFSRLFQTVSRDDPGALSNVTVAQ
jgi:hypothetical protein